MTSDRSRVAGGDGPEQPSEPNADKSDKKTDARKQRLSEALRANLRRRKEQARARRSDDG